MPLFRYKQAFAKILNLQQKYLKSNRYIVSGIFALYQCFFKPYLDVKMTP